MNHLNLNSFRLLVICWITLLTTTGCTQPNEEVEPPLEEKIGQLLMAGFRGVEITDTSHIVRDIKQYHLGGVILFDYDVPADSPDRNIESKEQVTSLNRSLQELSTVPLFVAIDQEGGRVARLKTERGFPETVSAEYLGDLDNRDTTHFYAAEQAELLHELGFNVNFAPVADLNTNPGNPVIGQLKRSYSADPDIVSKHAAIVIEEHQHQQVLPVLKHFPGHGSAWNDSHEGMADVTESWQPVELEPYRQLIDRSLQFGVMTAHIMNQHLDPELPATLSHPVQTKILRDSLSYSGILFSDDMQMEAIRSFYGLEFAIEHALNAGVDMLIFANNSVYRPDIVPDAVEIIKKLVETGAVSEERITEAYQRVVQAKKDLGLTK